MKVIIKQNVQIKKQFDELFIEIVSELKQRRLKNKISEIEMAKKLDISRSTFRRLESSTIKDVELLLKYSDYFNAEVGVVFEIENIFIK